MITLILSLFIPSQALSGQISVSSSAHVTRPAEPIALRVGPYLQHVTEHEITVMWETEQPCNGEVRYGRNQRVADDSPVKIHQLRLTALDPATRYRYSIHWDGQQRGPFQFRTAPTPGEIGVRLAVYGDSRSDPEVHGRNVAVMMRHKPDLAINTGDLVADGSRYDHWKPQFFDPLAPLTCTTALFTVPGNHERNSDHYYDYFGLPKGKSWWSTVYGNVHIVGLDSCQPLAPGSEQYGWAERALAAADPDHWLLVVCHHPMFSAHPTRGVNKNRWAWQPLFQKHGVDLVVTGHDHHYQRCHPIGSMVETRRDAMVHFTTGGGGAGLYPVKNWVWTAAAKSIHNSTILEFGRDNVRVRAFSEHGKLIDECRIQRNRRVPPAELVSYEAMLWERDLQRAAQRHNVVELEPSPAAGFEVHSELQVPSVFPADLEVRPSWKLGQGWELADPAAAKPFRLPTEGGATLPIALRARAPWPQCLPLPELELQLAKIDGKTACRNDTVKLIPFLIWPQRSIVCPQSERLVAVDSEPQEWPGVPETTHFVTGNGSRLAASQTRVRAQFDPSGLCVFAFVEMSDDSVFADGATDRDATNIVNRDESFAVLLQTTEHLYAFAVNTRGTQFDSVDGSREASPQFESAVSKAASSWRCEIRIPKSAFKGEPKRIDFVHRDGHSKEQSFWVPTLGSASERFGTLERS